MITTINALSVPLKACKHLWEGQFQLWFCDISDHIKLCLGTMSHFLFSLKPISKCTVSFIKGVKESSQKQNAIF